MTEPNDRPPDKLGTRLEMMAIGAAILMVALLAVGTGILIVDGDSPTGRSIGLHLITMGAVMIIAVGAAADHAAIILRQHQLANEHDRIEKKLGEVEEKLDEVAETLGRIMANVMCDDISEHRRNHMHN
jgi:ethanolamine utilization microcompartment shell protein EutS